MKKVRIKSLKMTNFKGTSAEYEFGDDVRISGRNGSGKSRIYDAIFYCLFGTDQFDRSIDVRTVGESLCNVECVIEVMKDGNAPVTKTLRRAMVDNKKRGVKNITSIDGIEMTQTNYNININEIATKQLFKAMSNPLYVMSQPMADRLSIVSSFMGLDNVNTASYKSEKKALTDEVESLNAKIMALNSSLGDDGDVNAVRTEIMTLEGQVNMLLKDTRSKSKEELMLEAELSRLDSMERAEQCNYERNKAAKLADITAQRKMAESEIAKNKSLIEGGKARIIELRTRYKEQMSVMNTDDSVCPMCGAVMTEEHFVKLRTNTLKAIQSEAERVKADLAQNEHNLEYHSLKISEYDRQMVQINQEGYMPTELAQKKLECTAKLLALPKRVEVDHTAEIDTLQSRLRELRDEQARLNVRIKNMESINELTDKRNEVLQRKADLMKLEAESRAKSIETYKSLEDKINDGGHIHISLYETTEDGDVKPRLLMTHNGVPIEWCSTAQKIIGGISLICMLRGGNGLNLPIIVDNAESVVMPYPDGVTDSQIFRMYATNTDFTVVNG